MAEIVLTNANVEVNDIPQLVAANTVTVMLGLGEADVKAASRGSAVVAVYSENFETKVGQVMKPHQLKRQLKASRLIKRQVLVTLFV